MQINKTRTAINVKSKRKAKKRYRTPLIIPPANDLDLNDAVWSDAYESPFYSALIAKAVPAGKDDCCYSGKITVFAQFLLFTGKANTTKLGKQWSGPAETISEPEYGHRMGVYNTWSINGIGGGLISSGYIRVNIEWDCKKNVTASVESSGYCRPHNATETSSISGSVWA